MPRGVWGGGTPPQARGDPGGRPPGPARRASRSSVGVTAKTSRMVALNCLMLAKPAAKAISDSGSAAVEPHVRPLRRDRRAGRAAVDAGRGHPDEEHAVEAGILAGGSLVTPLVVEGGHTACDRAVLAHVFHNASPRGPELAEIGHPP